MAHRAVCTDCFYRGRIIGSCERCQGWGTVEVVTLDEWAERQRTAATTREGE